MFRVKNKTIQEAFVKIVHHHYPTRHSKNNFTKHIYFTKYFSRLPCLKYLHIDQVSTIALLVKIQRILLQSNFLKENL